MVQLKMQCTSGLLCTKCTSSTSGNGTGALVAELCWRGLPIALGASRTHLPLLGKIELLHDVMMMMIVVMMVMIVVIMVMRTMKMINDC